ncbi:helix-turn-helix domain-containing protein [Nocardiopsis sediminis]|uniref:Helix-turn-helix domain-containing protein n=1 Tax=Nocardiopsis sediminis TaxID=1778267 RepID=A0ABV8FLN1_9ACTN
MARGQWSTANGCALPGTSSPTNTTSNRRSADRRSIKGSDRPIERIAAAAGFGTAANFRAVFRREVGLPPAAYRRSHRLEPGTAA